ncbi:MAG: accessory regulator [Clostridiales bacterium]|nr:accessory regulator [Clostridiales bacterium]MDK2933176.1 accessory regulator [Clostridiales bacterium]
MYSFEKISNAIACKISLILELDKEREEILAYGAFNLIHTVWSIFLIVLFGVLFNVLLYALIISFTAAFLRKYSGGAHATSPNRCAIIGIIIFDGFAIIVDKFIISANTIGLLIYAGLIFVFTHYIIYKYCPVDSPSKPIKNEETKQRLRKSSIRIIHVLAGMIIILFILYSNFKNIILLKSLICILIGLIWQTLTLTFPGHLIIKILDAFLRNMTALLKGGEV